MHRNAVLCGNGLLNDKILDWSKVNAFADTKINVTEKLEFIFGMVEKVVRKGENTGYQHLLLFPNCFKKSSSAALERVNPLPQNLEF